jgi:hypothetical protein
LPSKPTKLLILGYERAPRQETDQAHPTASQSKQNRKFYKTQVRLTTRGFDDIARDQKNRFLKIPYIWLLAESWTSRDYRAVIATTAIEVIIELP